MTVVSRIAKHSLVPGEKSVDFHYSCDACRSRNRIRLGSDRSELERETCTHFHDYNLAFLREGVVYFQFEA